MKKFFQDFKKFISKGNIVDMAVGVIVGSAFSAIVKALTDKIIMPFINFLLSLGGADEGLASAFTFLKKAINTDGSIDLSNSIYIDWGAFITAVLNFFIIALTLFIILKVATKSNELFKEARLKTLEEIEKNQISREEWKELEAQGITKKNKKAIKKYLIDRNQKELEKEKLAEEEKKRKEEDAKRNTTEYILKDIRSLLQQSLESTTPTLVKENSGNITNNKENKKRTKNK